MGKGRRNAKSLFFKENIKMGKKYRVYWSGTWNTPSTSTHMKENSKMKNSMAMERWRTTMAHTVECLSKDRNTGRGTSKPIEGRVTRELSHLEFWCKPMQQIQHLRKTKINMPEKRSYEKQKSINDSLFYSWKFSYYLPIVQNLIFLMNFNL